MKKPVILSIRFSLGLMVFSATTGAQDLPNRPDDTIPAQVELIYERGLQFLSKSQNDKGAWNDGVGSEPGVVGLCIASFLAHGEDPVNRQAETPFTPLLVCQTRQSDQLSPQLIQPLAAA